MGETESQREQESGRESEREEERLSRKQGGEIDGL